MNAEHTHTQFHLTIQHRQIVTQIMYAQALSQVVFATDSPLSHIETLESYETYGT